VTRLQVKPMQSYAVKPMQPSEVTRASPISAPLSQQHSRYSLKNLALACHAEIRTAKLCRPTVARARPF
jgi:hypothetical protein